jgi:hypothetical protein
MPPPVTFKFQHLGVILASIRPASGMQPDDLAPGDVLSALQTRGDLHDPGVLLDRDLIITIDEK